MDEFIDSFYLTLPSWDLSNTYPENNAGDYYCQLNQVHDLRGQWEVGLKTLFLKKLWWNINEGENIIRAGRMDGDSGELIWTTYRITDKNYDSFQELLDELNSLEFFHFEYEESLLKVFVSILDPMVEQIILAPGLATSLGFPPGHVFEKRMESAPYLMQLDKPREYVLITCDLVEPRAIGANTWPFLKMIRTSLASFGDYLEAGWDTEYIRVNKKAFNGVRISVRDLHNHPIPFQQGEGLVLLHFRRI